MNIRKSIRKFIVKQFVLDWNYFFGMNAPRAGAWIFPLMCANGLWVAFSPEPDWYLAVNWWLAVPLILALYLGFVHVQLWPAKWEELDKSQKHQYGFAKNLTKEQYAEWLEIIKEITRHEI